MATASYWLAVLRRETAADFATADRVQIQRPPADPHLWTLCGFTPGWRDEPGYRYPCGCCATHTGEWVKVCTRHDDVNGALRTLHGIPPTDIWPPKSASIDDLNLLIWFRRLLHQPITPLAVMLLRRQERAARRFDCLAHDRARYRALTDRLAAQRFRALDQWRRAVRRTTREGALSRLLVFLHGPGIATVLRRRRPRRRDAPLAAIDWFGDHHP